MIRERRPLRCAVRGFPPEFVRNLHMALRRRILAVPRERLRCELLAGPRYVRDERRLGVMPAPPTAKFRFDLAHASGPRG